MKAVALGAHRGRPVPFRMPYDGRENYHYVADVGEHFAQCALEPFDGFAALNIRGTTVAIRAFLALVERVAAQLGMGDAADLGVADDAEPALFVCDLDETAALRAFPGLPCTPLEEGVRRSLEDFRAMAADGRLGACEQ